MSENILEITNLKMHFTKTQGFFKKDVSTVRAVDGVGLTLRKGETLGIVGESGCGKSTLGRCIMRLYEPTAGSIKLTGEEIASKKEDELVNVRPKVQMIFQDPYASLNPRMTVFDIIAEPLITHKDFITKRALEEEVSKLMELVGLSSRFVKKYPHEFSGGQRQRIAIARAIAIKPQIIVCDEPVSALDVSIQAQIINLLMDLKEKLQLSLIFIAHDLSVVRHISDRVAVMYLGKICEQAPKNDLFNSPKHPYTQALLSAVPSPNPRSKSREILIKGELPSPFAPPPGCNFHTRCLKAETLCKNVEPGLHSSDEMHYTSCHFVKN